MKTIERIELKRLQDNDADLSWIGTFDDEAQSDLAVNHWKAQGFKGRDFEWFNPQEGACENKKQARQDYDRLIAYEQGFWYMLGIRAEATIRTDGLQNTVSSGGLWGIESDSDDAYLKEVEQEQLEELKTVLKELGFTKKQIESAS